MPLPDVEVLQTGEQGRAGSRLVEFGSANHYRELSNGDAGRHYRYLTLLLAMKALGQT
jgi:hypothetical protein